MQRFSVSIAVWLGIVLHSCLPTTGQIVVGDPAFPEDCFVNIDAADDDGDLRITREEYLTFAQLAGPPGIVDGIATFAEMPPEYRAVFTTLACLCSDPVFGGNPDTPDCCLGDDPAIRVPTAPGENQSEEELRMLFAICALTDAAAREVLNSEQPTAAPLSPTFLPTLLPTFLPVTSAPSPGPTVEPTLGPTDMPTAAPFLVPTATPTFAPTATPTTLPTSAPTAGPTFAPTSQPTFSPTTETRSPTASPTTAAPTISPAPSPVPSGAPTPSPTASAVPTSMPTTAAPSVGPTSLPTVTPILIQSFVNYSVAFLDGQDGDQADFFSDLIVGMDRTADAVAIGIWGEGRRLQEAVSVTVLKPTTIRQETTVDCNPTLTSAEDVCKDIQSVVTLQLRGGLDENDSRSTFQGALFNAIFDGDLQAQLNNLEADILVTTGLSDPDRVVDGGGDTLSSGAIGAVVAAALFGVAVPLCIFLYSRSRSSYEAELKRSAEVSHYQVAEVKEHMPSELDPESVDTSLYTDAAVYDSGTMQAGTLGAAQADYGRASRKAVEAMAAGEDIVAEPEMDAQPDSSSNAGSSGWSSSAGLSSYNTGSMDDSMDAAAAAGATLAAIGVSSNLSRKLDAERKSKATIGDVTAEGRVSRDNLDQLIEAGDWAAVGATAALLAAASDSQSASSKSGGRSGPGSSASGSLDAVRAAELDNLVEAGDWEGVVLAAARFESSDPAGSRGSRSGQSIDSASGTDSATGGATGSSPSVSESLTASDDPSKMKKRAEMRGEVEALVRRVVPEEIDNVDEMMNQFKGREEELVETLRTMQERAVAQKARQAGQRAAKVEARRNVQRGVVPGTSGVTTTNLGSGDVVEDDEGNTPRSGAESSASSAAGTDTTDGSLVRTALEHAIEAGDWDAVGQAAAVMSDASTASTGEIDRFANANLSQSSDGTPGSRKPFQGINASRAQELDEMIDQGNWSGVVAAASRFSQADKKPSARGRTAEEEEALAEADKWSKIAQQSQAEGATDAAASEAAEWAIQRSLTQMKQADKDKASTTANEDEDEV